MAFCSELSLVLASVRVLRVGDVVGAVGDVVGDVVEDVVNYIGDVGFSCEDIYFEVSKVEVTSPICFYNVSYDVSYHRCYISYTASTAFDIITPNSPEN